MGERVFESFTPSTHVYFYTIKIDIGCLRGLKLLRDYPVISTPFPSSSDRPLTEVEGDKRGVELTFFEVKIENVKPVLRSEGYWRRSKVVSRYESFCERT